MNAIVGDDVAATGAVRESDHRGRHTTTARSLLPVPGGGVLLDTPGVRSISLWDVEDGIALDVPGDRGARRLVPVRRLRPRRRAGLRGEGGARRRPDRPGPLRELGQAAARARYEARSVDPKLAAEEKQKWKAIHKAMRGQSRP